MDIYIAFFDIIITIIEKFKSWNIQNILNSFRWIPWTLQML